ncbi:hypothetical protein GCM10016455_26760 [Aliiroseovarius zhejiangensis]|uniref:Uncharacterized protein n=1 Tax=Aliiroseovarius zhejiangensis TaxID=1632025 RepID=A0ABQ3J824_9RHOB|nr:hypothetical protein [Aliiroseovarius zhejiangensis]GHF04070.1 hypothetical protein GCM10016455_26760 [Aliiroseovarius zhejiangensis]
MFTLISNFGLARALRAEFVPFVIALITAQLFFKWGSFSLELVGFVVLWAVLGFISDRVMPAPGKD